MTSAKRSRNGTVCRVRLQIFLLPETKTVCCACDGCTQATRTATCRFLCGSVTAGVVSCPLLFVVVIVFITLKNRSDHLSLSTYTWYHNYPYYLPSCWCDVHCCTAITGDPLGGGVQKTNARTEKWTPTNETMFTRKTNI